MSTEFEQPETAIRKVIDRLLAEGRETGIQVVAYVGHERVIDLAMGMTAELGGQAVQPDTLFSVFSVVKGVGAFCLHILAERGKLDFDLPVAHYWPEFGVNGKQAVTVRDVLTHRAGIPQMPEGVTPERLCDWNWMCAEIASLTPILRPGVDNAYMAMSFGWIVGELVRRIDTLHRPIERFVQEEICAPLGIEDLYLALPDSAYERYAEHTATPDPLPPADSLNIQAMPMSVRLVPEVFSRRDILAAPIPAVNGIASARGVARFFAMLANEGELDGVRLLSRERTRGLLQPRSVEEEFEPVLMRPWRLSTGGFFLASSHKPAVGSSDEMLFGMGMGGAVAWADMKTRTAVSVAHNKMLNARSPDTDPILEIATAVRAALHA